MARPSRIEYPGAWRRGALIKTREIICLVIFCVITLIPVGCAGPMGSMEPVQPMGPQNIREIEYVRDLDESPRLKFMTYNIRVGGGTENPFTSVRNLPSSRKKLERIALAIKSVDPDVVALQEVRGSHQATFLAETLNLNYAYSSHGRRGLDWGLAVLSKFKILKVYGKVIYYGRDQRVGVVYTIDINGSPVTVINVHYHLGNYEQQVKATMELLRDAKGPVVLMGDLNRTERAYELQPIYEKMIDTCKAVDTDGSRDAKKTGTVLTFSNHRIDYIFVDPKSFEVRDAGLIPEKHRRASDHIAYFACVTLKN